MNRERRRLLRSLGVVVLQAVETCPKCGGPVCPECGVETAVCECCGESNCETCGAVVVPPTLLAVN